jgi:Amt family ammonium transporter
MDPALPAVHLPLLAVVGALFMLVGVLGWLWSNPLQMDGLGEMAALRGTVNIFLFALSGGIAPLLYTWFVTGESDPAMTARGVAAGIIAGLTPAPFVSPLVAVVIGLLAGGAVPFITFGFNRLLKLNDSAGIVVMGGMPSVLGLLALGIFADGSVGEGWQRIGAGEYLGVVGQGVSGLLVMGGFQADFPGQFQAQMVGIVSLLLWGFAIGSLISGPLALLFHGVEVAAQSREARPSARRPRPEPSPDLPGYQPEIPAGPAQDLRWGEDRPQGSNGDNQERWEPYPRQRPDASSVRPAAPRDQ